MKDAAAENAAPGLPAVEALHLMKAYGSQEALAGVSLTIKQGEFTCVLGPSGSGKTTLLHTIVGLIEPDEGVLRVHGKDMAGVPPRKRECGMVFQDYALFPNMSVLDNVAYPLRVRGISRQERLKRAEEFLERVGLGAMSKRFPDALSGGERQRVAVARALVYRPAVLLLDEPLGALDRQLRLRLQSELKRLQTEVDITFVHVTHDQSEALALSDTLVVMSDGRVQQAGRPEDLYRRPASAFVAEFLGESSLLACDVDRARDGLVKASVRGCAPVRLHADQVAHGVASAGRLLLRPSDAQLTTEDSPSLGQDHLRLKARVLDCSFQGSHFAVTLDSATGRVTAHVTVPTPANRLVHVHWAASRLYLLPAE